MTTLERFAKPCTVFVRLALATAFLSSIADRFGLWGPPGAPGVNWGNLAHFTVYAGEVNSYLPTSLAPAAAWASTVAEAVLGFTLLLGLFTRTSAVLSGLLLFGFASALTVSFGVQKALSYSVFTASAGAFLLATMPSEAYGWSLDHLLRRVAPSRRVPSSARRATY